MCVCFSISRWKLRHSGGKWNQHCPAWIGRRWVETANPESWEVWFWAVQCLKQCLCLWHSCLIILHPFCPFLLFLTSIQLCFPGQDPWEAVIAYLFLCCCLSPGSHIWSFPLLAPVYIFFSLCELVTAYFICYPSAQGPQNPQQCFLSYFSV